MQTTFITSKLTCHVMRDSGVHPYPSLPFYSHYLVFKTKIVPFGEHSNVLDCVVSLVNLHQLGLQHVLSFSRE